jgi:predicted RecB family nuclease
MAEHAEVRINSRTALLCHEYIHKKFAPSHFDLTDRIDADPLPTALKAAGDQYEQEVVEVLEAEGIRIAHIHDFLADSRKLEETAKALANPEVDAIYGSLFISERRVSKPDLMVVIGSNEMGNRQWRPVDIKSHSASKENKSNSLRFTKLPDLSPELGEQAPGVLVKKDAYQLAHYIRHLQELGLCDETPWAGIIGTDSTKIVWADLNSISFGVGKSAEGILQMYDRDSEESFHIVKESIKRENDKSLPEVTIPRRISGDFGCPACELRKVCRKQMEAFDSDNGHVTLLSEITAEKATKYLNGIESIKELSAATNLPPQGMVAVKRARVWLSKKPERLDPNRPFFVPQFDVEIDIDLENSQEAVREAGFEDSIGRDAVYLYGYGVHERHLSSDWKSARFGYFDDYADTDEAEFSVLSRMWNFLQEQAALAESNGKTLGIFHYSSHERTWWRNFANRHASKPGSPTLQSVEDFIAKYFVDLLPIAQEIAFPVTGYSIKVLAPEARFKWRVDNAGGGNSIVYFQKATSSSSSVEDKEVAIAWLRSYNEDDVRATFAVRAYLRELAKVFQKE